MRVSLALNALFAVLVAAAVAVIGLSIVIVGDSRLLTNSLDRPTRFNVCPLLF